MTDDQSDGKNQLALTRRRQDPLLLHAPPFRIKMDGWDDGIGGMNDMFGFPEG